MTCVTCVACTYSNVSPNDSHILHTGEDRTTLHEQTAGSDSKQRGLKCLRRLASRPLRCISRHLSSIYPPLEEGECDQGNTWAEGDGKEVRAPSCLWFFQQGSRAVRQCCHRIRLCGVFGFAPGQVQRSLRWTKSLRKHFFKSVFQIAVFCGTIVLLLTSLYNCVNHASTLNEATASTSLPTDWQICKNESGKFSGKDKLPSHD